MGLKEFSIGVSPPSNNINNGSCRSAFFAKSGFVDRVYNATQAAPLLADSALVPVVLVWETTSSHFSIGPVVQSILIYSLSGLCTLLVSCGCFWSCWRWKTKDRKKEIKLRAKYFKGRLEQSSTTNREVMEKTKLFTTKELKKSTDNFSADRVLGRGGQGTVYKGMLTNGQVVAVKRPTTFEKSQWKEFINEVILLSQINHKNVVKLLGCCLETETPLLIYEFIPNDTLSHHIHNSITQLTWPMRVKIAYDVADAVAYLHSSSSTPIYHRDIKSINILLDDKFQAKVSDFGISRALSVDQTHLTTCVRGTFGYLDPEYFRSSQFSDKSDVYSYGVILVELLTGQQPIRVTSEEERSLVHYFISSMEKATLDEILDPIVLAHSKKEDVEIVAHLAKRCL